MSEYYPPAAFSFAVWFSGNPVLDTGFSEVSGLKSTWGTTEVSEGGVPVPHKLPASMSVGPVVMSRGLMLRASPLFAWCVSTLESTLTTPIIPQDIAVALLGTDRLPMITWNVSRAWPVSWEMEPFQSDESRVAMERIEFACHGITRLPLTVLPAGGMVADGG